MQARQTHIDALKLIGSQLIVLHHFAAYGPLADAMSQAAPTLSAWLYDYARMAVQVFLVLGGYLAARNLAPEGQIRIGSPWRTLWRRYQRLALPFTVALLLAMVAAMLARHWLADDFIPAAPTWGQTLSHALLLHSVLDQESLSAGVWYVAIDFQLFALMTLLLWLGRRRLWAVLLVLGLMLASLFFFNRDADWDNWALYFFGAYGMGALAYWIGSSRHPAKLLGLLALAGLFALMLDFRGRIALALVVALLLALLQWRDHTRRFQSVMPAPLSRAVGLLGQSSYALFLVHFPVLMLGNALFAKLLPAGTAMAIGVLLASWAISLGLALLFERWVEAPLSRLGGLRRKSAP
ncbi:MAG: acyltransferase [Hylemonella sp.]|nr:acyltransferase [Hylemonella sp.]MDP1937044.1 acyltransferase [Hylemonella sp.]